MYKGHPRGECLAPGSTYVGATSEGRRRRMRAVDMMRRLQITLGTLCCWLPTCSLHLHRSRVAAADSNTLLFDASMYSDSHSTLSMSYAVVHYTVLPTSAPPRPTLLPASPTNTR